MARRGKMRPVGRVFNAWQLLHESDFEDTDTKLLMHCYNDTDFAQGVTVTNNSVSYSTSVWKFAPGSASFDGASSYLTVPASSDWAFGTGNFTIDFWINPSTVSASSFLLMQVNDLGVPGDQNISIYLRSNGSALRAEIGFVVGTANIAYYYTGYNITATGTWYHVMFTRNGSTGKCFLNGVDDTTESLAYGSQSMPTCAQVVNIGKNYNATLYYSGYLDEFRLVKGTAKKTVAFTPPTYPYHGRTTNYYITDPNNVLMISGQGANASTTVIDECGNAVTCNGGAAITTAQYKFGNSCIAMDGNGDYLSVGDSGDWYFGVQPFTIDFWVRFNALPSGSFAVALSQYADGSNNYEFYLYDSGGGAYKWYFEQNGTSAISTNWDSGINATGVWYHIALTRSGSSWVVYENGVSLGTKTIATTIDNIGGGLIIGNRGSDTTKGINGWMADIRISKGIARWTSNFTAPLRTTALINGDTDEEYKLLVETVNGYNGACTYYLNLNNDVGTNYGRQQLTGSNTTVDAARSGSETFWYTGYANALNYLSMSETLLYAKSGYVRTALTTRNYSIETVNVLGSNIQGTSWNNTADPVAALTISPSQDGGLGCGSKFLLYRKVRP